LQNAFNRGGPNATNPQSYSGVVGSSYTVKSVSASPPTMTVERVPTAGDALTLDPGASLQRGDHYRVIGTVVNPSQGDLRASSTTYPSEVLPYLQLPDNFPKSVRDLAAELVTGRATAFDRAMAIEGYLRLIPYDETFPRPQPGADRVERFLFGTQRGYFDYHSSAMVVMLRSVGVPARLATGYSLQERGQDGRFILREQHIYSWPEVYFTGIGWVAFNPTPNTPPIIRPGAEIPDIGPTTPIEEIGPPEFELSEIEGLALDQPTSTLQVNDDGGGIGWAVWAALGILGVIVIGAVGGRWYWEQSLAGLPPPAKLWEKTQRLALLAGMGSHPQQTPREFARDLHDKVENTESVDRLARAYERTRFGAGDLDGEEQRRLDEDYRSVRNSLLSRIFRWRKREEYDR
jgi:hypothetical protein